MNHALIALLDLVTLGALATARAPCKDKERMGLFTQCALCSTGRVVTSEVKT